MNRILLKIGGNTLVLLLVNGVGAIAGFLLAATLGRGLGNAGFGQYTLVITWLLTLMLFTEFGFSTVLTRDLAALPELTHAYLLNSLAAKGMLGLPVALLLLFAAPVLAVEQNAEVVAAHLFLALDQEGHGVVAHLALVDLQPHGERMAQDARLKVHDRLT